MDTKEIMLKLKRIKPQLYSEFGVKSICLFGSFADGTYTDASDIDLLVEFEHPVGWQFFKLENYLEKTFNRKIDLVTANAIKEHIKPYILNNIKYI